MTRKEILVLGMDFDLETETKITSGLQAIALQEGCAETLPLIFESLSAKSFSFCLADAKKDIGYVLILGKDALEKYGQSTQQNLIECTTFKFEDWSGPFRSKVIEQLRPFLRSWANWELELSIQKEYDKNEKDIRRWVETSPETLKNFIAMRIMNGRPQALFMNDDESVELCDATKRLKMPIKEVMLIVANSADIANNENLLKTLNSAGYEKPFLVGVDEFVDHIKFLTTKDDLHIIIKSHARVEKT